MVSILNFNFILQSFVSFYAGRVSYTPFQHPVIKVDWRVFLTQTLLHLFFIRAIIPLTLEMQQILLLSKMKLLLRKSVTLLHLWLSKSGDVTMNNSSFSRMRLEIRPVITNSVEENRLGDLFFLYIVPPQAYYS